MPSKTRKPVRRIRGARATAATRLIITIDGPAGSGKSTVARRLAKRLGLTYLDTGATYRALALAVLTEHPEVMADERQLARMAYDLPIRLQANGREGLRVFLAGMDVTRAIRSQKISEAAAQVSQFPSVRAAMVLHQRKLAGNWGVVVEGRDTGTVVFPDATHKFFLRADIAQRAHRRQRELEKLYHEPAVLAQIREELELRDVIDASRPVGPLVEPQGALVIDTTDLSIDEVLKRMVAKIRPRQGRRR